MVTVDCTREDAPEDCPQGLSYSGANVTVSNEQVTLDGRILFDRMEDGGWRKAWIPVKDITIYLH